MKTIFRQISMNFQQIFLFYICENSRLFNYTQPIIAKTNMENKNYSEPLGRFVVSNK